VPEHAKISVFRGTSTTLLDALEHVLSHAQISYGRLRLIFDRNVQIDVTPASSWNHGRSAPATTC